MTEREQFEAWARGPGGYTEDELKVWNGQYLDEHANTALDAWQASRRAALEEACAAIKAEDDQQSDNDYMLDSDDCIRVIRALSSP